MHFVKVVLFQINTVLDRELPGSEMICSGSGQIVSDPTGARSTSLGIGTGSGDKNKKWSRTTQARVLNYSKENVNK